MRRHPRRLIGSSQEAGREKQILKKFLYRNLYQHPAFEAEKEQGIQVVESLFQFYLDHPEKMPPWYAALAERGPKHRVVCDYIAGMTDHYIQRLHKDAEQSGFGPGLAGGSPLLTTAERGDPGSAASGCRS